MPLTRRKAQSEHPYPLRIPRAIAGDVSCRAAHLDHHARRAGRNGGEVVISAALAIALSAAVVWIVFRAAAQISYIDDRTAADLRDAFPAANPQPPAESTQEAASPLTHR